MGKRHSAALKAQVMQEVLREEKTIAQIASEYGIPPNQISNQISNWKSAAFKGLPNLFETEKGASEKRAEKEAPEKQLQELYAQIGRLTTQVAWRKKIWPRTSVENSGGRWRSSSGTDQSCRCSCKQIVSASVAPA